MFEFFTKPFPNFGFMPHGQCFLWLEELLFLHVVSDSLIALAYYSIPVALFYFVRRRTDLEFRGIFLMFAAFILACGTTHILDVWTIWRPDYWIDGLVKAVTAAVSVSTAILLWMLMPAALALPSPGQLRVANENLRREAAAHRQALAALEESEERFRGAFEHAAIGMALVSREGRWLQVNQALCDIVGYAEQELLNRDFQSITHPHDLEMDLAYVQEMLEGRRQTYQMEKRYIHKNGGAVWVLLAVSMVQEAQDGPPYFVAQIKNIDERKQAEAALLEARRNLQKQVAARTRELAEINAELEETNRRLERMARIDDLTGLSNRRHLMERLERALETARRYKFPLCVLLLDVDHFKRVNDTYGHLVGDRVLRALGRLLMENLRSSDIAGRYGGEELCIVLTHVDLRQAEVAAQKLRQRLLAMAIPDSAGGTLTVTVSIGIAEWRQSDGDIVEFLNRADKALYRAKQAGRDRVMTDQSESGDDTTTAAVSGPSAMPHS